MIISIVAHAPSIISTLKNYEKAAQKYMEKRHELLNKLKNNQ
jgi:hypothetical protein